MTDSKKNEKPRRQAPTEADGETADEKRERDQANMTGRASGEETKPAK